MTGWIPFEKIAEIYKLDTSATEAQDKYDHRYREGIPVDPDGDGVPDEPRVDADVIEIRAGVERDREALMQMTTGGDVPDGSVGLVIMTYRLAHLNLFDVKGHPLIRKRARLGRILDLDGTPVDVYDGEPLPEMYCISVGPAQADIGGKTNAWLFIFHDDPKG